MRISQKNEEIVISNLEQSTYIHIIRLTQITTKN